MQRIYSFQRVCCNDRRTSSWLGWVSRANDTRGNGTWCGIQVPAPRQRMRCDDDAPVRLRVGESACWWRRGEVTFVFSSRGLNGLGSLAGGPLHGASLPGGHVGGEEERVGRALAIVVLLRIPRIGPCWPALTRCIDGPLFLHFSEGRCRRSWVSPSMVKVLGVGFPLLPRLWRLVSLSC